HADRPHERRDARPPAHLLSAAAAGDGGGRPHLGRGPPADRPPARRADGRGGGRGEERRAQRRSARGGQGLLRRHRQYRPLLRRGYLPRDRLDPADEGRARRLWLSDRAPALLAVGDPDRDRRLPHPRPPPPPPRTAHAKTGGERMITLDFVYVLAGITFALFALLGLYDRGNPKRFGNAAFWGLLAVSMLLGDTLGDFGNGLLVLALVAIAGMGQIGRAPGGDVPASVQAERAAKHGPFLLLVALIIPAVA